MPFGIVPRRAKEGFDGGTEPTGAPQLRPVSQTTRKRLDTFLVEAGQDTRQPIEEVFIKAAQARAFTHAFNNRASR
jgi:hypothetical protein